MPAPIALFVYSRPDLTRRTLDALAANPLADRSELIVFSDGPRAPADAPKVEAVRALVAGAKGFSCVRLVVAPANLGLAGSILSGVTKVNDEFGRIIVMEDDIETSPYFLGYMNDALDRYADQPRVAAVSGFHPPMDVALPETFFQRDAECWGWATWQRAWSGFETDGATLLAELKRRNLLRFFDQDGTFAYGDMLRGQIAGTNNSWAVRWRAHVILNDLLSLYPGRSLTRNIGNDGSGTHSGFSDFWGDALSETPVMVAEILLRHSEQAFEGFRRFNRRNIKTSLTGKLAQLVRRLKY
jgi:hypothetical protein